MEAASGKVVLVTGASSGLGRATADHLAERGHRVYGTSRDPAAVQAGAGWTLLPLDVCSDRSVRDCVAAVEAREGRIDALVNNAGHAFVGAIEETSLDEARAQLETNFFGPLRMMHAVLPLMRRSGAGRIVNISSLAGAVSFPFLGAYGASKQALEAISEALDYELIGTGIRVMLMEPDGMRTAISFHHPRTEHPALAAKRRRLLGQLEHGTRAGGMEPALLARAVADAIEHEAAPFRSVIGDLAQEIIAARRTLPEGQFRDLIADRLQLRGAPATA